MVGCTLEGLREGNSGQTLIKYPDCEYAGVNGKDALGEHGSEDFTLVLFDFQLEGEIDIEQAPIGGINFLANFSGWGKLGEICTDGGKNGVGDFISLCKTEFDESIGGDFSGNALDFSLLEFGDNKGFELGNGLHETAP